MFSGETAGMFLQEALLPQTDRATRYPDTANCTANPQHVKVLFILFLYFTLFNMTDKGPEGH